MNDCNELMLDIETLGKSPDCIVLSIGACFFDIKGKKIGATFHLKSAKGVTLLIMYQVVYFAHF